MSIKRVQNTLSWMAFISMVSHLFCCVLPAFLSVLTILVGFGLIGVMPMWVDSMHHIMHDWEMPLIIGSGAVLSLGWLIQFISWRIDCHDTGCGHEEPCAPKKKRSARILIFATILFVINVLVFFGAHH